MEVENRYIAVRHHVDGPPSEDDFEVKSAPVHWTAESGEVLVRNMYVSIDPGQLNRMKRHSASQQSVGAIVPGERIVAHGVGEVLASACLEYEVDASSGFPLSYHVGVLGMSGTTAYGGFFEVCQPQSGEKVFVSAASGSVGSLVGQFAKLAGCYVVDLLKGKLGFDDAFNYKEELDLKSALNKYFPDGIDIYFENVGGEMLEAALANMNTYGRVAVCGAIAEYTDPGRRAAPGLMDVVYKRIALRGFLSYDFMTQFHEYNAIIRNWIREGRIQVIEDVSNGLESVPSAFAALFRGENVGKKLVKLP
ncbi:hypothetical protein QYE76_026608 [Lolium multiflorum]|uniref:Enoyl reductase (ER) domain-containing protein n=1 Tax=Lolium multiflorum TaxID=4521 RepID=A0AAD8RI07_LOLMU|nr:hypothetical protein QYE76_026608 [Lolium multiflorum]